MSRAHPHSSRFSMSQHCLAQHDAGKACGPHLLSADTSISDLRLDESVDVELMGRDAIP